MTGDDIVRALAAGGSDDPYPLYAQLHRLGEALALTAPEPATPTWRDHAVLVTLMNSMMFSNGDQHGRMRGLFRKVFTPRRVQAMEPEIVRITAELLDRIAELGADGSEVDYMAEFAYLLPARVVGRLLGLPDEDIAWFRSQADLISDLTQAVDDGLHAVTDLELVGNLLVLFNASFSTTIHLFGNALPLLLERPEIRSTPELMPAYVEEVLRYDTPAHVFIRVASADTEFLGVPLREGELVAVLTGAANRDPRRFAEPDRFDPARPDNQPISFGAGAHYCLGAALARAEAQLALPLVLERFPQLALGSEPVRTDQLILRGYKSLPITVADRVLITAGGTADASG